MKVSFIIMPITSLFSYQLLCCLLFDSVFILLKHLHILLKALLGHVLSLRWQFLKPQIEA